jgi:hypothetical protein
LVEIKPLKERNEGGFVVSYCKNCGEKAENGDIYCGKCGGKIDWEKEANQGVELGGNRAAMPEMIQGTVKGNKKIIVGIVMAVIVAVIGIIGFFIWSYEKKKVDLNDCYTVTFSGYDTVGEASANIDMDKFNKAVLKAQGKKVPDDQSEISQNNLQDIADNLTLENIQNGLVNYSLAESIKANVTPSENLKNGDTVTVTYSFDEELAKQNGIRFVAEDQTYTVSGLSEIKEVDPFDNIEVTYTGIAPNATLVLNNTATDEYLSSISYTADKEEGINVGDTITVTLDADENEALHQGYRFTQTSKTYTCDKADHYIMSLGEITPETLSKLQASATENLDEYILKYPITGSGWTYEGAYLVMAKEILDTNPKNGIIFVYSNTVSSTTNMFTPFNCYFIVVYPDLIENANGEQSANLENRDMGNYKQGTDIYQQLIIANKDQYNYEVSDSLKQFGE